MAYVTGSSGGSVGVPGRMVMPSIDPSVLNIDTQGIMKAGFEFGRRIATAKKDRENELKLEAAKIKAAEAVANKGTTEATKDAATMQTEIDSLNAKGEAMTVEQRLKRDALVQSRDALLRKADAQAKAEATLAEGAEAQAPDVVAASGNVAKTNVLSSAGTLERTPQAEEIKGKTQALQAGALAGMTPEKPYSGTLAPGMSVVGVPGKDGVSFETVRAPTGILSQGTGETRSVPVLNADGTQATDENGNPMFRVQAQNMAGGWADKGQIRGMQGGSTASQVLANVPAQVPDSRVPNPLAPKSATPESAATGQAPSEPVKTAAETLQPEVFSPQASLRKAQQTSFVKSWEKKEENLSKELEATSALRDVIRNTKAVAETAHVGITNRVESLLPVQIQQDDKVVLDKLTNQLTTSTLKSTFGSRITNMDIEQQAKVNPNGTMSRGQIMSILNMSDAAAERKTAHAEFMAEAKRYGASPLTAENMWAKYVDAVPIIAKNSDTGVWEKVKAPTIDEWINTPKKKEVEAAPTKTGTPTTRRVVQDGVTYEFDGSSWNAVK